MSDWDYHDIKIIGPEVELNKLCSLYLYKIGFGRWGFDHDIKDFKPEELNSGRGCYGEAALHFSSKGQLALITIHVETCGTVDYKLIQTLQTEFPGLLFHSFIYYNYDYTMHFTFTKVEKGVVCKSEGIPIIENVTIPEFDKGMWINYYNDAKSMIWLERVLDSDIRNIRYLKMKKINMKKSARPSAKKINQNRS